MSLLLAAALAVADPSALAVSKLADGVFAVTRPGPPGLMFDANNLFVIDDDGVVVVDSNVDPASTREVLAALRKITDKPVRFLVHTHWHDDHVMGDAVWKEAFPAVEIVAQERAWQDMTTEGAKNRNGLLDYAPQGIAMLRDAIAKGKDIAGGDLTEETRKSYERDLFLVERYVADAPSFAPVEPTIEISDRMTLRRGGRTIEIFHPGEAHTRADLVVWLPAERILASGDIVVWPVPLAGSSSTITAWPATLEKLIALDPKLVLPGHGKVLEGTEYLTLEASVFSSAVDQVKAAIGRGEPVEEARKSVDLSTFRKTIAGDSPLRGVLFDMYVASPAIAGAYRELTEAR